VSTAKVTIWILAIAVLLLVLIIFSQTATLKEVRNNNLSLNATITQMDYSISSLSSQVETLESSKLEIENKLRISINTISSLSSQVNVLESTKLELENKLRVANNTITKLNSTIKELETKLRNTLPFSGAASKDLRLVNQDNVHNPTWKELKAFIIRDNTDKLPYNKQDMICGDFATMLHNNAELAGIRCGAVYIGFLGEKIGHAINIFYTTDYGYIYIDSTGTSTKPTDGCTRDLVAFVKEGEELGYIHITHTTNFSYDGYMEYSNEYNNYIDDLNACITDIDNYIAYLKGTTYNSSYADVWSKRIDAEINRLDAISQDFTCVFEERGIVNEIILYW
jgi:prefoldin subunit 5